MMGDLLQSIDTLDLTLRTRNCLKAENILTIYQLIQRSEIEMCRTPNLGKRSVAEIKEQLEMRSLSLGTVPKMDVQIIRPLKDRQSVMVILSNGTRKVIGDGEPFTIDEYKMLRGMEETQKGLCDQSTERPLAYSINEACRLLSISRRHFYNLLSEGKIQTVTIGARRVVSREELERIVREGA